ncbi:MAG: tRNA uridine-5-carboxymethylaminomethyl(34) synthesis enzyme MnmG, partial [Woeseiaceae bacterium]|nr:tRNA uridine-5-carboxymethylaminomethyl(34) synthesis enzyme MnmG [Woeseiaceae bacterium]
LRLTPKGRELGLVDDERWDVFEQKRDAIERERCRLGSIVVRPDRLTAEERSAAVSELNREVRASELLRRPEFGYAAVTGLEQVGAADLRALPSDEIREQVALQLEVEARYEGYIDRQQRDIERQSREASMPLPADLDYRRVTGLSTEARQRLESARPETLGQASRLEGVTPSTVSLLLIHLKKQSLRKSA